MLGPCWLYFSLLGASWPHFARLAAFVVARNLFLCVLGLSGLEFYAPGRVLEASGLDFGGRNPLVFERFGCARAFAAYIARTQQNTVKTDTKHTFSFFALSLSV